MYGPHSMPSDMEYIVITARRTQICDISHTTNRRSGYTEHVNDCREECACRQRKPSPGGFWIFVQSGTLRSTADLAGMPPSTVYSMLNEKSQNPGVVSIKKICDGPDISLRAFFDCDLFDDLEQEIK